MGHAPVLRILVFLRMERQRKKSEEMISTIGKRSKQAAPMRGQLGERFCNQDFAAVRGCWLQVEMEKTTPRTMAIARTMRLGMNGSFAAMR
jgi:hypothetical protein